MIRLKLAILLLVSLTVAGATDVARAAESYDNCTGYINSLPAVISTGGIWCLKHDLNTAIADGDAIHINGTNDVTIDCNNFKIGGLAAGIGTNATGIWAANLANFKVRHCNIRGFASGMYLQFATRAVIEDNRFDNNTAVAIGISSDGTSSVVRRNQVFNTGGSTTNPDAIGILGAGSTDILDNTVTGVRATAGGGGNAIGIWSDQGDASVDGNRVRNVRKDGSGLAYAIRGTGYGRVIVRRNDLVANSSGTGITCTDATSLAVDNAIIGFSTGITACTDAGGNVIAP
jgi:nitrous oxidase accessory protein NosD